MGGPQLLLRPAEVHCLRIADDAGQFLLWLTEVHGLWFDERRVRALRIEHGGHQDWPGLGSI
ncbi:MAG TPA: hypothetical protein DEA96_17635 [Leptospiraceae bacterium]|nr:hypothetical protein [Spirochaetaceae bacterium]HBS06796.1 hypothetical protein [Leptospiraceae bacterium]